MLALSLGCGDDDATTDAGTDAAADAAQWDGGYITGEGCNPLGAWDCLLPFPSDHFLVEDSSLPAGRRVVLPDPARIPFGAVPLDYFTLRVVDGFSMAAPILAYFPVALDAAPLVRWDEDVSATTRGEGPTVLVDAATGERVPHFAELDASASSTLTRALIIRPLRRLAPRTRYVVGLRELIDEDGVPAPVPDAFRRLRDGEAGADLARYDAEIFPVLEAAGFARGSLQLAWDFTTGSDELVMGDMLAARRIAMEALAAGEVRVAVREVIEGDALDDRLRETTARQVELEVTGPRILESLEPGEGWLLRDDEGALRQEGEVTFGVTVIVPLSLVAREPEAPPARLVQYGHGFFGLRSELVTGYMDQFANEHALVGMAADWWGMSQPDRDVLAVSLVEGRPNAVEAFVERTHQGLLNFMLLAGVAERIAQLPELADEEGEPLIDAAQVYFWGNSMGHILGGVFGALDPTVEQVMLGVGGANYSLIMFRSRAFAALRFLLELAVEGDLARQTFASWLQYSLDRIDPLHYAAFATRSPLEGNPAKRFLLHTGPGDEAVTHLAAELHARELGIPLLVPSAFEPPLLERATAPTPSALVTFDYGVAIEPKARVPAELNPIHEAVRRNPRGQAQVDAFFRPGGVVTQTCDGPCDPE